MLRLQPGDDITLFDGSGGEWHARIDVIGRSAVSVQLIEHVATTRELHELIEKALQREPFSGEELREVVKKSSARTFQALRIDVNHEYEVLYDFLTKLPAALAPGGRAAILTFHSGEDRLVKQAFKEGLRAGDCQDISRGVIRPGAAECAQNGRAHSTTLRWAERA